MPELDPCDEQLIAAAKCNRTLDFTCLQAEGEATQAKKPKLNVAIFRCVLSGSDPSGNPICGTGCLSWLIKGASFGGTVDLSDLSCGKLPAIEFEGCDFPQGFAADNSSFVRLAFRHCNFGIFQEPDQLLLSISLRNATIKGDVTLRHLGSLHEQKLLVVDGTNIRVEGGFYISDSTLLAPKPTRTRVEQPSNYALNLFRAEIRSDLSLYPRLMVSGGVRLRECQAGSDVHLMGLTVDDGCTPLERQAQRPQSYLQKYALDGTSLSIRGNLFVSPMSDLQRFTASGDVTLYGMTVEGSVQLGDAIFGSSIENPALTLAAARIRGSLFAEPAERKLGEAPQKLNVSGTLSLAGAQIDGILYLDGRVSALDAKLIKVTGDVSLALQVGSYVILDGANIQGMLDLSSFSFPDRAWNAKKNVYVFRLRDADIGHTLYLANSPTSSNLVFKGCERTKVFCYPHYSVFSVDLESGTASILWKPGALPHVLDGTSGHFHEMNQAGALDLSTDDAVRDYIKLFGAYVWGEHGPFVIIDEVQQLPASDVSDQVCDQIRQGILLDHEFQSSDWDQIKSSLKAAWEEFQLLEKTSIEETQFDQVWLRCQEHFQRHGIRAHTFVRYSNHIFRATFVVLTKSFDAFAHKNVLKRLITSRLNKQLAAHFKNRMSPYRAGYIGMLDDESVFDVSEKNIRIYERPLIRRASFPTRDYSRIPNDTFTLTELSLRIPDWRTLLTSRLARFQDAQLNLTNATCKTLDDADGRAWGSDFGALGIENFTYSNIAATGSSVVVRSFLGNVVFFTHKRKERIHRVLLHPIISRYFFRSVKRESFSDRLRWLERIPKENFNPQPYAHLAAVLDKVGNSGGAKAVEQAKTDREVQEHYETMRARGLLHFPFSLSYLFIWRLFRICFGYGLSPRRATATLVLCLFLGWRGTDVFNHTGYLIQSTSTSATLIARDSAGLPIPAFPRAPSNDEISDLPCGSSINQLLYAVDVFIPLLDLRQETRCDIRSPHPDETYPVSLSTRSPDFSIRPRLFLYSIFTSVVFWTQIAKSLYAILGWVVISGAILTYSGYLRRRVKE